MKEKYKIGEVAKLYNITNRTLTYYDEIDLFKPKYIDEENGYRYYSDSQLIDLYFILSLKESGLSLNEIKRYTALKNLKDSIEFLKFKEKLIEQKIKDLRKIKNIMKEKRHELELMDSIENIDPLIIKAGPFKAFLKNVPSPYTKIEIAKVYAEFSKLEENLYFEDTKYISIISKEDLQNNEFYKIKRIGILIPDEESYPSELIYEEMEFATITHKGSYKTLENTYKKLLEFIESNLYEIIGDSIEITISNWMVKIDEEIGWIIKILIPVKK